MTPIRRLLVATDFSTCAAAAARFAASLAQQLKAAVDVVTVVDTSPLATAYGDAAFRAERIAAIHAEAQEKAEKFAEEHFAAISNVSVSVRDGDAFLEIIQASKDLGSDLLVLGTHGRTGLAHLLIGSVAEKVVRKSEVPVLTVRAPE